MEVVPIAGAPFGAVVRDVDRPAGEGFAELMAHHELLVVEGERTEAEHIALVSTLGRVLPQGPRVAVGDPPPLDPPIVTYVSNDAHRGQLGESELLFHHDLAHTPNPYGGLSLYSLDVAPGQAPTRYASGTRAYGALDPSRRSRLEGLQGLFIGNYTTLGERALDARAAREVLDPTWPCAVHPLVIRHPRSGRPCLFVNEMQTIAILGLPPHESDDLLDELFAVLYESAGVYEHQWRPDQLVLWDNVALQHARPGALGGRSPHAAPHRVGRPFPVGKLARCGVAAPTAGVAATALWR